MAGDDEEVVMPDLFEEDAPAPLADREWSRVTLPNDMYVEIEARLLAVWASAHYVTRWLCEHPLAVRTKTVCELGCGAGLPSLACARLGAASVLGTDYDESAIAALERAAAWNGIDKYVSTRTLDWFAALEADHNLPTFDLLIAADCIYYARAAPALVACARAMTARGGRLLLASREDRIGLSEVLELLGAEGSGWRLESTAPFSDDCEIGPKQADGVARAMHGEPWAEAAGGKAAAADAVPIAASRVSPRSASRMWIYVRCEYMWDYCTNKSRIYE